jgi:hypothetical protein
MLKKSPNRRPASRAAHRCSLVCILRTAMPAVYGCGQDTAPVFTGASSDITFPPCLTRCRPSRCTRLSRARSTTAALSHPRLRQASPLSPHQPLRLRGARGTHADGSHVHCCPVNGLGTRALPLRPRHGYAAVLHRGLQTRAGETQPGVPAVARRARTANQPESTGLELAEIQEA